MKVAAVRFVVLAVLVGAVVSCGASIQGSSGTNAGQFPVGTAGTYQYTIRTMQSESDPGWLELENNDVTCNGCKPVGPWEVQLPIAAGTTTATGTIYLMAGDYTGVPGYIGLSWSLTLSPSN